jgi:DNA polymerase-3 subunit gamma/tau
MPLHLDYRPATLDEIIGNESVKDSLSSIFARKDRPHTFLFIGPSGTGKTTLGRIVKNMLECSDSDFIELNSANTRGIDTIRELSQNCHYSPIDGNVKVYLLDEVHQQTKDAQHAILKLLEDTPSHVYIILCTTEPEKLLKTIHTRCTTYQTKPLTEKETKALLCSVLKKEKVSDFSDKVLNEIIRVSEGCPRQALVILDQVIDILDETAAFSAVSSFSSEEAEVIDICRALFKNENWNTVKGKVKAVIQNVEPEKIRYAILGYMQAVLLNKADDRASMLIDLFSENTYSSGKAGLVNSIYLATKK